MITELNQILLRNRATLLSDALGVASLGVVLISALHAPAILSVFF